MDFKTMTRQEKLDTRENLIHQMRALNDGCKDEKGEVRSFTAEEENKYNGMAEDVRQLTALISEEKRSEQLAGFADSIPVPGSEGESREAPSKEMEEFRQYLISGEKRDLVVDGVSNTAGALAPQEYVKKILANVQSEVKVLDRCNVIHLNQAASIGVPTESVDAADAAWTTEVPVSLTADSTWAFGKREIGANQLIKLVKVSNKLIKTSAFPIDQLVGDKLSIKMRQALENAIIKGDGSGKPLGVFTASASGVSTGRDVTTGTALTISADDIIATKRNVKQAYRSKGVWVINPEILTDVILLKDNNDQYIWRSGLTDNDPDRLYGSEVIESDFAPSAKTGGSYVAVFGDFSNYWVTMVDQISVQVLKEAFATSGEVGYLATAFADGAPVLEEAFSRLKIKAS